MKTWRLFKKRTNPEKKKFYLVRTKRRSHPFAINEFKLFYKAKFTESHRMLLKHKIASCISILVCEDTNLLNSLVFAAPHCTRPSAASASRRVSFCEYPIFVARRADLFHSTNSRTMNS